MIGNIYRAGTNTNLVTHKENKTKSLQFREIKDLNSEIC